MAINQLCNHVLSPFKLYTFKVLQNYFKNKYETVLSLVTGCNQNDLDIWMDWCRLGLQFVVNKSAEQEWSFIN